VTVYGFTSARGSAFAPFHSTPLPRCPHFLIDVPAKGVFFLTFPSSSLNPQPEPQTGQGWSDLPRHRSHRLSRWLKRFLEFPFFSGFSKHRNPPCFRRPPRTSLHFDKSGARCISFLHPHNSFFVPSTPMVKVVVFVLVPRGLSLDLRSGWTVVFVS